jgi:hypothetical protein
VLFEIVKSIARNKKVMVTQMSKIQKPVSETLINACNVIRNVFCATVWTFGAEVAVVPVQM